jgi:hypothetical protein
MTMPTPSFRADEARQDRRHVGAAERGEHASTLS